MKRSIIWRARHFVHNVVAHPLLPVAEVLSCDSKMALWIYRFHDMTNPEDDCKNRVLFFCKDESNDKGPMS